MRCSLGIKLVLAGLIVAAPVAAGVGSGRLSAASGHPRVAARSGPWAALRRPLRIPSIPRGGTCPRTVGGRDAPRVAVTIGRGPVFPVLGMPAAPPDPRGVVSIHGERRGRWGAYHKTLWASAPAASGRVLVRGRRVDGHGEIRFQVARERPRRELHLAAATGKRSSWRYFPTASVVPRAGCWAFQIDGAKFSRVVVFRVVAHAVAASSRYRDPQASSGRVLQ